MTNISNAPTSFSGAKLYIIGAIIEKLQYCPEREVFKLKYMLRYSGLSYVANVAHIVKIKNQNQANPLYYI